MSANEVLRAKDARDYILRQTFGGFLLDMREETGMDEETILFVNDRTGGEENKFTDSIMGIAMRYKYSLCCDVYVTTYDGEECFFRRWETEDGTIYHKIKIFTRDELFVTKDGWWVDQAELEAVEPDVIEHKYAEYYDPETGKLFDPATGEEIFEDDDIPKTPEQQARERALRSIASSEADELSELTDQVSQDL